LLRETLLFLNWQAARLPVNFQYAEICRDRWRRRFGVTCGVVFAERGFRTAIFAQRIGQRTTSGAAAALWFPYDAQPADKVIPWALATYKVLVDLTKDPRSGRLNDRAPPILSHRPNSNSRLGCPLCHSTEVEKSLTVFSPVSQSTFRSWTPPSTSTISRTVSEKRRLNQRERSFRKLEDVEPQFDLVINCAGIGARELVRDLDLEPHRGQVAIVPKIDK